MALGGDEVMFSYNKRLQYPVDIKKKDLKMAKYLVTQYGGSNGELAASLRYLTKDLPCLMIKEKHFLLI